MIIYGLYADDMNASFHASFKAALKEARARGPQKETGASITAYDIGKLDKAKACALASGCGFAERQRDVWPIKGDWT
jgi:hypothetical protein